MNNLVVLSPIDSDDLEMFLDKVEEILRTTAEQHPEKTGPFKPLNRMLIREVNKCFGTGRCRVPTGVYNIVNGDAQFLFTPAEQTAVIAMIDLACIPNISVDPEM